jgi:hypothetical protein
MMIETLLGAIPVAGDVFDFVWKANKRYFNLSFSIFKPLL